jgi:arabinose-5-phosphate isomerase
MLAMILETGRGALLQEAEAIRVLADRLDESFERAVEWMLACEGRVITCGLGKSGHIARKTAGTLSSTGTPSLFLHAAEAVHGDLGMVTSRDVVVMYSHSGETDELVRLFPSLRAIGAKTILITGRPDSSAGHEADLSLNTCVSEEACPNNLAPTTSTTVMLALSDALAIAVMDRRGFSREDFAKYHPSGTLGKRLLLTVADVMRPLRECALVQADTAYLDIDRAITRAGVGAAMVVDENGGLQGFISDGDMRRYLLKTNGDLSGTAGQIMNTSVATIEPTLLAIEAFEAIQNHERKGGEMPVVDNGKLVGLIMLKDIVRSGIL